MLSRSIAGLQDGTEPVSVSAGRNMSLPRPPSDVGRIALARSTEDIVMPETVAVIANKRLSLVK